MRGGSDAGSGSNGEDGPGSGGHGEQPDDSGRFLRGAAKQGDATSGESSAATSNPGRVGWHGLKRPGNIFRDKWIEQAGHALVDEIGRDKVISLEERTIQGTMRELAEDSRAPDSQKILAKLQATYGAHPSPEWLMPALKGRAKRNAEQRLFPGMMRAAYFDEDFVRATGEKPLQGPPNAGPEQVGPAEGHTEQQFQHIVETRFPKGFPDVKEDPR